MFDVVSKFNAAPLPCTPELLHQTMAQPVVQQTCGQIAQLVKTQIEPLEMLMAETDDEARLAELEQQERGLWEQVAQLKKHLPAFCFQAHFTGGRRSNKQAESSGLVMLDVDDLAEPRAWLDDAKIQKCKDAKIGLVHVTPSTRGLRFVGQIPAGMSLEEAQAWLAHELGFTQWDGCTKDLARISFAVPESYVLYLDEETLFSMKNEEGLKMKNEELRMKNGEGGMKNEVGKMKNEELRMKNGEGRMKNGPAEEEGAAPMFNAQCSMFNGLNYSDIIAQWLKAKGIDGRPMDGIRNNTLYNLVLDLRYICEFDHSRLMQVVPRWDLPEQEVSSTVASALKADRLRRGYPALIERIVFRKELDATRGRNKSNVLRPQPPLPTELPPLLSLITKDYPVAYRPAILIAALPLLGTLATHARARYFDGALHSPSFLTCIVAPQASGKSCTRALVDLLMHPLQRQDSLEREKERKYLEERRAKRNSKQQPEDPRAKIRIVPATISNAMLFKRLDCAQGAHLFTYAEEIDTLSKGRKSGAWSQKDDIMRQAFDNSMAGQDYMSENSWSAMVRVYYNQLICGTPVAVRRYYNDVEGGLVSRVCFAQLPDMLGAQLPVFGHLSEEETEGVRKTAKSLMAITEAQEFDIPYVKQVIWEWLEARRLEYLETQENPALDIFRRRAAVIGFRAGLLAMLVSDGKETDAVLDFCRWVADYTLQQQLQLFGSEMNRLMLEEYEQAQKVQEFYPALFSLLPEVFTTEDLAELRAKANYRSPQKTVVWRWRQQHMIEDLGDGKFRKTVNVKH